MGKTERITLCEMRVRPLNDNFILFEYRNIKGCSKKKKVEEIIQLRK